MKFGLLTAILEGTTFEEAVDFAAENQLECLEVACWPNTGGAKRRYAGVCHIDAEALTEEKARKLLKLKEQEELIYAAEQVKNNNINNKLEYEKLDQVISKVGQDFSLKAFLNNMLQEKKLQSEINLHSRRRKISPKTVTSYLGTANRQVIPVWGDSDIRTIATEQMQQHFDTLDYSEKYLKDIRLILKMTFQKAIDLGVIKENPATKIYIGNRKYNKGIEIEHLDKERQAVWLDLFEQDADNGHIYLRVYF